MNDETVSLEIENNVAHITLNRAAVHNAFDEEMIASLSNIFDNMSIRDDIVAVVLRGAGKSFSAGADLNWMKRAANYTREQNRADALVLAEMLEKFNNLPKVTIACVQGAAMGGGLGLVCCCDIVIADSAAKFALSEVKLGLVPATISPYVLAAIGIRNARRYFQTGERISAEEAQRIGLVHMVAKRPEDMSYQLHNILKELQDNGRRAMATSKKLCMDLAGKEINQDVIEGTARIIAEIRASDEAKEGVAAFLEKRNPDFN